MPNRSENLSSNVSIYKDKKMEDIIISFIDKVKYPVNFSKKLDEFSSEQAEAFDINANCYALVFKNSFAPPLHLISSIYEEQPPNIQKILAFGKIKDTNTGQERLSVILKKISGIKLSDLIEKEGSINEKRLYELNIFNQLFNIVDFFYNENHAHGCINTDTIFFDISINKLTILAPLMHYSGFLQYAAFLPIDSLLTHPAARATYDSHADLFGFGMTVLSLISGMYPYSRSMTDELVTNIRFENGTMDSAVVFAKTNKKFTYSLRTENLFKGLLTDNTNIKWGIEELKNWLKKIDITTASSNLHKESLYAFRFNNSEYVGRKSLAHAIHKNWNESRKTLKLTELSRWISLSLKNVVMAEKISDLASGKLDNVIHTDEKIVRIISILDPTGPIRYKDISVNIDGIPSFLSYCYQNGHREHIQQIASIINDGSIIYWENQQSGNYHKDKTKLEKNYDNAKIRNYLRKKTLCFGMERVLYDLNPTLPCQSEILTDFFAISVRDILISLDKKYISYDIDDEEIGDPIDRHIAAYIAFHVALEDDIKLKSMQNYPKIANNQQILATGLLTVAQSEINGEPLNNLTKWITKRLSTLISCLHSNKIKNELSTGINKAAESGNIKSIFKIVANPTYARNDHFGFKKARKEYHSLMYQIRAFQKQSNIEKLAYQLGLRIAVTISYILCAITIVFVMFQSL